MSMSFRSRVTGFLTCVAAVVAVVSLRFGRSVFLGILERSNTPDNALSNLAAFALGATRPAILLLFLLFCLAVVAVAEATVKAEVSRLLVQAAILLLLVSLLAVALSGFLISFHIPDVRIP